MPSQVYLGSLAINSYTLCIALGALVGCAYTVWQARASWRQASQTLNALLIIGVSALVMGRAGYALLNISYFSERPTEIISLSSPGYWEQAAIIGGLLGWALAQRVGWRISGSALIILATLIGAGASIGCIPHGCAYGREVFWTQGWVWQFNVDWPDAYLLNNPRLPTQLFLAGWLVITLAVSLLAGRRREWLVIWVWLIGFAIGDFAIQFLRADTSPLLGGGLRVPQCADIALAVCGTLGLLISRFRRSSPDTVEITRAQNS